jgi:hypothetical protein
MVSAFDGNTKKMKNPPIKSALFFLLLSPFLLNNLHAAGPLRDAPPKYVMDNASVLKANTADRLSGQLADLDHRTADELIVVIDPNLPKEFRLVNTRGNCTIVGTLVNEERIPVRSF